MKVRLISGTIDDPKVVAIACPGCEEEHQIWVKHPNANGALWEFNKDYVNPTFSPSLHIEGTRARTEKFVCHSQITEGVVVFFNDSTHWLKGDSCELLTVYEE
jgi:hypothetical protein